MSSEMYVHTYICAQGQCQQQCADERAGSQRFAGKQPIVYVNI